MKRMVRLFLSSLMALWPGLALASTTVILSTTTYPGTLDTSAPIAAALPAYGPYLFTIQVTPVSGTLTNFNAYLQQKGLSGTLYTINNSTFTSCSGTCTQTIATDVFSGGTIVPRWTVGNGSATVTFSAISVTP